MAETDNESPVAKLIIILFLVSAVLFGYYVISRGPGNSGIVRVVPTEDRVVKKALQEEEKEEQQLEQGEVRGAEIVDPCAQRPGFYGDCGLFLGVYDNGTECVRVYGCDLNGDRPPYFSVPECSIACEQSGALETPNTP